MDQPEIKKSNPLAGYFRQPVIHLRLPSKGRFWPEGAIDMPINEELPVYPMTTKDEITLRTPDALLNGAGIAEIIQSCVPAIKDAWHCPSVDLDALLIAIRLATFGEMLEIETICPHCKAENSHETDLRGVLDQIVCPDYSTKLQYKDMLIKLKPQAYFTTNKAGIIRFEEQKIIQTLNNADLPPEVKKAEITKSMDKLNEISLDVVTDSTEYVELPDGNVVSSREFIREFYGKSENKVTKTVQTRLAEISDQTQIAPRTVQCNECTKQYTVPLDFNYSNFFG